MKKRGSSWLKPVLERLSVWFLRPRRRRDAWLRDRLSQSVEAVLPRTLRDGPAAVALVEASMALSQADGSYGQEEFELYLACLDRLDLGRGELGGMSLSEDPDPSQIRAALQGLQDAASQAAIGRCLVMFVAADGGTAIAERELLAGFLEALNHPGLLSELPALCRQFHYRFTPLDQLRVGVGEWLSQRLLDSRRRRDVRLG